MTPAPLLCLALVTLFAASATAAPFVSCSTFTSRTACEANSCCNGSGCLWVETCRENGNTGICDHQRQRTVGRCECVGPQTPVACTPGQWTAWSTCSPDSCTATTQTRSRKVLTPARCGGACTTLDSQACPVQRLVNCVWSEWTAWSACSSCLQSRTRSIATPAKCGGTPCAGSTSQQQACGAVKCVIGQWGAWSTCSKTCGMGTQTRARSPTRVPACGGATCIESVTDSQTCQIAAPQNCVWGPWSTWGTCSKTCGGGTQSRQRAVATAKNSCGADCVGNQSESKACGTAPCPIDCVPSTWTMWSACNNECGDSERTRTREVQSESANGGEPCGDLIERQACTKPDCTCQIDQWSAWTTCSKTCGGGMRTRQRSISRMENDCPSDLTQSESCNNAACPRACTVTDWGDWSMCSVSCGGGTRSRTRTISVTAIGMDCNFDLTTNESCNTHACDQPVPNQDCILESWGDFTACSKTCGGGVQTRTRGVLTPASGNGKACSDEREETAACNTQQCVNLEGLVNCDTYVSCAECSTFSACKWCKRGESQSCVRADADTVCTESITNTLDCATNAFTNIGGAPTTAPPVVTTTTVAMDNVETTADDVVRKKVVVDVGDLDVTGDDGSETDEKEVKLDSGVSLRIKGSGTGDEAVVLKRGTSGNLGLTETETGEAVLASGQAISFEFATPTVLNELRLSSFDAGETAMLEFSDTKERRRTVLVANSLQITEAVTSAEAQTNQGFTFYRLTAMENSEFGVAGLSLETLEKRMDVLGAPVIESEQGLGLPIIIAIAGGAFCCLLCVGLVVFLVMRRGGGGNNSTQLAELTTVQPDANNNNSLPATSQDAWDNNSVTSHSTYQSLSTGTELVKEGAYQDLPRSDQNSYQNLQLSDTVTVGMPYGSAGGTMGPPPVSRPGAAYQPLGVQPSPVTNPYYQSVPTPTDETGAYVPLPDQ